MPRKGPAPKRPLVVDPVYASPLVTQLVNKVLFSGKRSLAERIVYDALDLIEQRAHRNPLEIFEQAIKNATPAIEVKPRRVGGATYQVPVEIRGERKMALAMRWLIASSRKRPGGRSMAEKLAAELMDTAAGQSATTRKKDETHKMADANKAFAHYRY
jgi:small subunit ribosomal protein S7